MKMEQYREYINTIATAFDVPAMMVTSDTIEVIRTGSLNRTLVSSLSYLLVKRRGEKPTNNKKVKKSLVRTDDKYGITFLTAVLETSPFISATFGPFFLGEKNIDLLVSDLCAIETIHFTEERAREAVMAIPTKDESFVQAWGRVMETLRNTKIVPYAKISIFKNRKSLNHSSITGKDEEFENSTIRASYAFQREIYQLAKLGDSERLKNMLIPKNEEAIEKARKDYTQQYRKSSSTQNLRRIKNLIISVNTIFRMAAEENGITAVSLNNISESVVAKVEQSPNEDSLIDVLDFIIKSYCNAINNAYLQNHSINVVKVQRYIMNHLKEKITLEELSELTHLAPQYLCKLFKAECRITINDYIREQRINEAKWLLESTDLPLMEIADHLGFSDQTYFSTVFKKVTGLTPRHYRANRGGYYRKNS